MSYRFKLLILAAALLSGSLLMPSTFAGVWSCWPSEGGKSTFVCSSAYAEEYDWYETEYNRKVACVKEVIRNKTNTAKFLKAWKDKIVVIKGSNYIITVNIEDTVEPFPNLLWWDWELNDQCLDGQI